MTDLAISLTITVALLISAASLGSWFISQWTGGRQRASNTMIVMGGTGIVLVISAAALMIISAPTGWRSLLPTFGFAEIGVGNLQTGQPEAESSDPIPSQAASTSPDAGKHRRDDDIRARRELRDFPDEPSQHADSSASTSVPATPRAAVSPSEARPIDRPGISSVASFDSSKDWPATECVQSRHVDDPDRWFLDNECHGVVAVIFSWCQRSDSTCDLNAAGSNGWRYEPAGILMTTLAQRPLPHRLANDGPLFAPTYVLKKAGDLRIRYLACYVTGTKILDLLNNPHDFVSDAEREAAFDEALHADNCYERVAQWSRIGQRTGKAPDALLSKSIDL